MMQSSEGIPELKLSQVLATFTITDVTITNLNCIIDLFLEYLLREENSISQPEVILQWLIGWLENTSTIPWNVAHRILHLMSTIITLCKYFSCSEDIIWILNRIGQLNSEVDIKNKIEFIKILMFTLSHEKLKKTFVQTSDFNESNDSAISLNVTYVRKAPINVTKLPHYTSATLYSKKDCQQEYLKYIEEVESKQPVVFKLQVNSTSVNEHDLQALVIMLSVAKGFGNFEPVFIGDFKAEEKTTNGFINCYLQIPYLTHCNLRAEYCIHNRLMSCDLPSLNFTFPDFFRQLPITESERSEVFQEIWEILLSEGAIQSFLLLELLSEDIRRKLNSKLTPFIVSKKDVEDSKEIIHIGIYLPPGKHLLFQFFIDHTRTKVTILTESTYILSCANTFLKNL